MARGNFPPSLKNQDIVKIIFSDILLCGVLFLFFCCCFFFQYRISQKACLLFMRVSPSPITMVRIGKIMRTTARWTRRIVDARWKSYMTVGGAKVKWSTENWNYHYHYHLQKYYVKFYDNSEDYIGGGYFPLLPHVLFFI